MGYSLDSNIVIALMAGNSTVRSRIIAQEPGSIFLSSIVLHDLMFGAFNSQRVETNLVKLERLAFPLLPFDEADARAAGEVRAALKRLGSPIGTLDVLIAGQALARDLIMVTANCREFERVKGLLVEDWTAT
ncbi:MAG: type II toxin-antitoxin system VapC family toxin [Sphingomonas sp.]|jgi:tRNA(fMet)-specific endonuclease VapC|uniref:type II toxin-antitoxin system VapC family toxin n=1 Tax=Sphingomonas sp. TaxID=28214 RepID=UPI00356A3280